MDKNQNLTIREATDLEDLLIAKHFYQLWLDNNVTPDSIRDDWSEVTIEFIAKARQELLFKAFVALIGERVVGSASCQLFAGLYPLPFKANFREGATPESNSGACVARRYGYIWNVFVEPNFRRQGIATKLTTSCIEYLRSINCTHGILHASSHGKPVYEGLGFIPKNEMILELTNTTAH